MALGPFTQYTPPAVYGPVPVSWIYGSGPTPKWARDVIKDLCMANVGRMRCSRAPRWVLRYFKRRDEAARKEAEKEGVGIFLPRDTTVKARMTFDSEGQPFLTVLWWSTMECSIVIPKDALVPSTLTLLSVHDC